MKPVMWDAADPANIPPGSFCAGYLTGTPGQMWQTSGRSMNVSIDQAGSGAPRPDATVKDVEPGCYLPSDIPGFEFDSSVQRPTVYCDRSELADVMAVWSGDIWLAFPGWTPSMGLPSKQVVAVQNVFAGTYDQSVILDPYWPEKKPQETDMLHDMIQPSRTDFIPFPPGTFKQLLLFHDFNKTEVNVVRVAVHSAEHGFSQITYHQVTTTTPETVTFSAADVDGVSLANDSPVPVGWTLA